MSQRGPLSWAMQEQRVRKQGHTVALVALASCVVVPLWWWLLPVLLKALGLAEWIGAGQVPIPSLAWAIILLPTAAVGLLGFWMFYSAARLRIGVPMLEGCFALLVCFGQLWATLALTAMRHIS